MAFGFISAIIGGIGIFAHGLVNLGKGEANAHYSPSAMNNLAGYAFSILFWGGIVLIIVGIIMKLLNKGSDDEPSAIPPKISIKPVDSAMNVKNDGSDPPTKPEDT